MGPTVHRVIGETDPKGLVPWFPYAETADDARFSPEAVIVLFVDQFVKNLKKRSEIKKRISSSRALGLTVGLEGFVTHTTLSADDCDSSSVSVSTSGVTLILRSSNFSVGTAGVEIFGEVFRAVSEEEGRQQDSSLLHGVPPEGSRSKHGASVVTDMMFSAVLAGRTDASRTMTERTARRSLGTNVRLVSPLGTVPHDGCHLHEEIAPVLTFEDLPKFNDERHSCRRHPEAPGSCDRYGTNGMPCNTATKRSLSRPMRLHKLMLPCQVILLISQSYSWSPPITLQPTRRTGPSSPASAALRRPSSQCRRQSSNRTQRNLFDFFKPSPPPEPEPEKDASRNQPAVEEPDLVERMFSVFFGKPEESPLGLKRFGQADFPEQYPATIDTWAEPLEGDDKDVALLRPLLKNTNLERRKLKLVYNANANGWNPVAFHKAVDKKGPSLVVLTTTSGQVAGGYNPKGWVSYGEARGSIAAFLFTRNSDGSYTKLRKVGGPSLAQMDYPESGPMFGADSLIVPLSGDNPKAARSKLGSYYERFADGTKSLFGKDASVQLRDFKVYQGVYADGEYIPFTDAEPFALY